MSSLQHIQAIAFDLDGTLCNSIPDLASSANAMRQALGMNALPADTIQSYVGNGIGTLVHRTLSDDHHGKAPEDLWQQGLTLFMKHYAQNLSHSTRPYPHTEEALKLFKSLQLPLAVITNKSERLAVKLLKELHLADYFSIIVGGDTLSTSKPSPEPLLFVAEVLGVEPQHMAMVGDSHNDIIAAKLASCPSIGVTFGYGDAQELNRDPQTTPDLWVNSLPEIYQHLRPTPSQS